MIRSQLRKAISKAVPRLKPEQVKLEHPLEEQHGDYSSNIAMQIKTPPEKIITALKKNLPPFIERVESKNSFINFFVKKEYFLRELKEALQKGDQYGQSGVLKNKKIMVEYAHPNTHKAFHIGHLRNISNGEAVVRILGALNAKVIRANYQGDVGLHIAKCLWSLLQNKNTRSLPSLEKKIESLANAYVKGNRVYETDPKAKKEILEINKKIYDQSDPKINQLWEKTRQWSLDYFSRIYKRLYTSFDRYYFESEVAQAGKQIVLKALEKGIFKKSKGAIIFPGSKFGLHDRVFITKEGNPTYEAKDMELGRLQFREYNPDLIIHNIGPEQGAYLKVIFKAFGQIYPEHQGRKYHLMYGWVRLKKGKMSSRTGNVIEGEWLLDETKKQIKKDFPKVDEKTAEQIAVGAVKYSFLKVAPATDVAFDIKESVSLQGNSGPYLQYTYARCQSVLRKAGRYWLNLSAKMFSSNAKAVYNILIYYKRKPSLLNQEEISILKYFYRFPEIVSQSGEEYNPSLICAFLYELAQRFNTFYNKHRILGKDKPTTGFRLALAQTTAQILKNGLYLLGIQAPEKM